jgi:type I restriction-modification system DNA methylase subunit
MAADVHFKQSILDLLQNLRGLKKLKDLFWTELNYDRAATLLSRRSWPEPRQRLLAEDPTLLATAGAGGEFHVIYCRLASERLSVLEERQVIGTLLQQHPYALFVFSNLAHDAWHFVNVKVAAPRDTEENRDAGRRRLFRRITVAPGELLRTAAERLSLLDVETVDGGSRASALAIQQRHDEAFDVDKVTRAFYKRYSEVFDEVERAISAASGKAFTSNPDAKRLFTQRLFNRLMFLAFVQKKGWLTYDGNSDYLRALWKDYRSHKDAEPEENHNFYRDRLQLLFFAALNGERDVAGINHGGVLKDLIGDTVYLNGGLFERDELDETSGVVVPDHAISLILNDLFGSFNFTVSEATPLDVEVAVDPEMLGKVFEELVTGRHESGSYYTPKPIVAFMCREALKGYLQTAVPQEAPEEIARFVDEHVASGLKNGEAILQALKDVKACDPACGSGAYLLGMLHELLDLREALFATKKLDTGSVYGRKLEIIQNNLYGVDLDHFAVNIARLRLWLSLVVDFEREDPTEPVPPLPNLDFKIEQGDSLAAPLARQYHLSDQVIHEFDKAKAVYMRSHLGDKRVARAEVDRLRQDIAGWAHAGAKVDGFDWPVEFAEVFAEKPAPATIGGELNLGHELAANHPGGFDIVLANPPYVRQELIKDQKPRLKANFPDVYSGTADLYVFFYARALELLAPSGMLAFISPNKWFKAAYGAKLRKYMGENAKVESMTDFGDLPVFETATTYPMIFIAQKGKLEKSRVGPIFTQPRSLQPPYPDVRALVITLGHRLPSDAVQGEEWQLTDAATSARLGVMRKHGVSLSEYVHGQIYYGIKTGLNHAFVIDGATRVELIRQDPASTEIIRPLIIGRDIEKWCVNYSDRWLLFMDWNIDISRYPAVMRHLGRWKQDLAKRPEVRDGRYAWYCLGRYGAEYHHLFPEPKIVYQEIATYQAFALDGAGSVMNNKVFFISSHDLYLLGVLNSDPAWEFLSARCSKLSGGALAMQTPVVTQLPIPRASFTDREAIAELVQRCLDAGGKGLQVAEWEAEINDRVAVLYGLKAPAAPASAT